MSTVISVENLSKSYRLGQIGTGTFANDLKVWWARTRGKPNPLLKIGQTDHGNQAGDELWALKDVSFTVEQGEVLGIIGRNGAGKSTLLKILSRVTAPTSGVVKVKGRIASLLEVGTGFHPELTGRENIFLNGAILGMTRPEVTRKFDEIVDFSEVGQFIDTPVKRYSSGMYVRLAFAVAAHLDPEILVVDEVLAVGDAEFQKKCIGKMGEVAQGGRTVLFVSHNMPSIQKLCESVILIQNGMIKEQGKAFEVVEHYIKSSLLDSSIHTRVVEKDKKLNAWLDRVSTKVNNIPNRVLKYGDSLTLEAFFSSITATSKPSIGFTISTLSGEVILNSNNIYLPAPQYSEPVNKGKIECDLGVVPLMEGRYLISFWFGENSTANHQYLENILSFDVVENYVWDSRKLPSKRISHFWWPTQFRLECVD